MLLLPVFRMLYAPAFPKRVLVLVIGLLAAACSHHQDPAPPVLPDRIDFVSAGLYPESVFYDRSRNAFFVSSLVQGQVGLVSAAGAYQPFVQDAELISSVGVRLDSARHRVLVAAGDFGFTPRSTPQTIGKQAFLAIYDQANGRRQALVRLSDLRPNVPHVANDVALDPAGNAYVTDSFSGIIYKVDPDGHASVLVESTALAPNPSQGPAGLSGIVYHPDGYLLVSKLDENKLLKISLRLPAAISEVAVSGGTTPNPDAIVLSRDGRRLIVVTNGFSGGASGAVALETHDNWASAQQVNSFDSGPVGPTAAAVVGDAVYVLYSNFNQFIAGTTPPTATFTLQKLPFSLSGR